VQDEGNLAQRFSGQTSSFSFAQDTPPCGHRNGVNLDVQGSRWQVASSRWQVPSFLPFAFLISQYVKRHVFAVKGSAATTF